MILVFYNKDMNVCIFQYSSNDGVLALEQKDIYLNKDTDAKLFKEKLGVTDYFIDKVLLSAQGRFKGQRVIIFDNSRDGSMYDRADLVDMLFLYRREITILKADVSEEDADSLATWLYEHFPL